jgi:uncharacterized membrane protein
MLGLITVLLVVFLGAAAVGAVVTGLFWLTLIALALFLVTGAVGVSLHLQRADDSPSPVEHEAEVRPISSRRRAQGGGEFSRAA